MVGSEVSHYKIVEQLGSGGMGVVYRAVDLRLDRPVALKFLSPYLTTDLEARERFIQEAKAASALQHNNICTIHDIDQASDGRLFIVMDCYRGTTLKRRLEAEPPGVEETIAIAAQIAAGLSCAHEHGIVHRDIKPDNIFVTDEGVVKILDFGLAKLSGHSLTRDEATTKGTVAYMSPEQITGGDVDSSTDIWSFGVVLYEMLTRSLPFEGRLAPAVMYAILHEDPPEVTALQPDVPQALAALCARCLAKERLMRPPSMAAVLAAIEGRPVPRRPLRTRRYWPVITALAVAAGALVVLYRPPPSGESPQISRATLGILQFKDLTHDSTANEWPEALQALMVSCLTGVEGLRVYDPAGPNTVVGEGNARGLDLAGMQEGPHLPPIDFLIEGSILREGMDFVLHMNIRDRASREVLSSNLGIVHGETDLPRVADSLSLVGVEFLQSRAVLPGHANHLQPWWPKRFPSIYAMKAFTRACQLALAGDQEQSENALRRAVALDPSFVTPRVWLVTRLAWRGDTTGARAQLHTLIAARDSAGPFDRATIAWAQASMDHDTAEEIKSLNHALEYSPGNAILLYSLGRAEYLSRDYADCAKILQPIADRGWEYPHLYLLLAQAYDMLEDYDAERNVLKAALAMRHPPPEAHSFMATLLRRSNDSDAARSEDKAFVELMAQKGTSLRTIYTSLSTLNITEGFLSEGVQYYRMAVRDSPEMPAAHFERAESLCVQGDTMNAIVEYVRTIAVDSMSPRGPFRLAEILESLGEREKAVDYYKISVALDSAASRSTIARKRIAALQQ